ncbi:MAG TPA: VPLPA-CTERM-specific exosortase XrtD [Gammaproteobacteria bacterium]|nr:VPLPA-CTERM-specific exosortase XrtD [Gammaproteobacteria bacterium]
MVEDINMVNDEFIRKNSLVSWGIIGVTSFLLLYVFQDAVSSFLHQWEREEYSHAYMIPVICAFFVWQKKNLLETIDFEGSWRGVAVTLIGFFLYILGLLSAIHSIMHYAVVITIIGIAWSYYGNKAFKLVAVPFLILLFMVPLPGFLYESLSGHLQLLSSEIGVAVIRLFGISVYLEGNVIDLGVYQLQVVEACNGLRYLFPLVTLSFIAAYMYQEKVWKRLVIFLSAVPITVLMNSFRIGIIGVLVEYWGLSMAEGFLHDFEGWIVFMACIAVLFLEMWLLAKLSTEKRPFIEVFGLDLPDPANPELPVRERKNSIQFYTVVAIVVVAALALSLFPEREDIVPQRKTFAEFPLEIDGRVSNKQVMEKIYTDSLNFDDYLLTNYIKQGTDTDFVNVYIAYYDIQRADKVPHSPKACIPGGGWKIASMTKKRVADSDISGVPLEVNRLIIQKGEFKQLVYYWFQQRGRIITDEYLMKWYLFSDAMTMKRTDGALIRLTTMLEPGQDIEMADERLEAFAKEFSPIISEYVPQ